MQLTIQATGEHVDVLSYLLAKNPNNRYERNNNGHLIRMFYNKFTSKEVEVTFFVTPDPIALSRDHSERYDITSYINDREFVVSSIFCSFLRSALGTALNGKPKEEYMPWVEHQFTFQFSFGPIASDLTDKQIENIFQPLGYDVEINYGQAEYQVDLRKKSTARWITLNGTTTLQAGLRQLYVLIPVLDNYKHYYIDEKEVEKIERFGKDWLNNHPDRDFILQRALRFKELYRSLEMEVEPKPVPNKTENRIRLNELRYEKIINYVNKLKHKASIIDFGSGEGKLAVRLGFVKGVQEILAVEPSEGETLKAMDRFEKIKEKDNFVQPTPVMSSLFYYDERLKNKDIIILCEVIEHIDEHRLPKVMKTILEDYQPKSIIITTPNKEYNQIYELGEGYRHPDHRFEWTRNEFQDWCVEQNPGTYDLIFDGIGEEHPTFGCPTQLCLFSRKEDY